MELNRKQFSLDYAGRPLTLEVSRIAEQASASVIGKYGDTTVLATVVLGKKDKLFLGNLEAKRDWGYAKDYVEAMWMMLQKESPDDYVIATGETHSVREFVESASSLLGMKIKWEGKDLKEKGIDENTGKEIINIDEKYYRPSEVDLLLGDASKARDQLGWQTKIKFDNLVRYSASPGTFILRQRAPVARMTVRPLSTAPFSSSTVA
jgi:GDP-mannose 4,6-dehydratase